jgi:hypothetical protein
MTHKNIQMALAAAQAEMGAAKKTADNLHFRSKYADLAEVVAAAKPALTKHGICYYAVAETNDYGRFMVTVLAHGESGTEIRCPVELFIGKQDVQGYKSATTYAKRIGLESLTGLAPEDDDGNAAASAAPATLPKAKAPKVELPADIEPDLPDFIKWCRDQHGGGQGFGEYVAKTFIALWNKKPSEGQLRSAWDKNKAALEWLENHDKKEHGHVIDGYETRMMTLTGNYTTEAAE